jgi:hypothetical protein
VSVDSTSNHDFSESRYLYRHIVLDRVNRCLETSSQLALDPVCSRFNRTVDRE